MADEHRKMMIKRKALKVFGYAGRACALLAVVAWPIARTFVRLSPSALDFRLSRRSLEQVVARAKQIKLNPMGGGYFRTPPVGLVRAEDNETGLVGQVEVQRAEDGRYTVTITTKDDGHLGVWGYRYTDAELTAAERDCSGIVERLAPHWYVRFQDE